MFCTACGAKVNEGQAFCVNCGARLPSQPPAPPAPGPSAPHPLAPASQKSTNWPLILAVALAAVILIGIVAAVAIPNLLIATQKAKVKATQKDMNIIAIALADYITDNGKTPVQNGRLEGNSEFPRALIPIYAKQIPVKDQWGNNFLVYCGEACNGQYGLSGCGVDDFLVVSLAKDGLKENWAYDPSSPDAGIYFHSSIRDFDNDLINYNGTWIRAPQR
jgi:type II secretory pathway pseudopilin PulG